MFVIGLTGGMAAGKSTVTRYLKPRVAEVIDADKVAKQLIAPGTDTYQRLVNTFGQGILGRDGAIDRGRLGRVVFADQHKLSELNRLTHPLIVRQIKRRLDDLDARLSSDDIVLITAPLLIEVGLTEMVDTVVLVTAPKDVRIRRIKNQRGLTEEESLQRLRAQLPDPEKLKHADHVIENDGTPDDLRQKVDRLWAEMQEQVKTAGRK